MHKYIIERDIPEIGRRGARGIAQSGEEVQ